MNSSFQILLICLIVVTCKRSTSFTNNPNKNSNLLTDHEHRKQNPEADFKKISKNDLEDLNAGDGLTVGNGQNDTEDIKNDIEILGAFFTRCKYLGSRLLCQISKPPKNTQEFADNLVFFDQSGSIIPSNKLSLEILIAEAAKKTYLQIVSEVKIGQIVEKQSIDLLESIRAHINDRIKIEQNIKNKQNPQISYGEDPNKKNSILFSCSGNCPDPSLLQGDEPKFIELCQLLKESESILGITYDLYFNSLNQACQAQINKGDQADDQSSNKKLQIDEGDQTTGQVVTEPITTDTSLSDTTPNETSSNDEQSEEENFSFNINPGQKMRVGTKLVNNNFSLVLDDSSIRIEGEQYGGVHTVYTGNYDFIELTEKDRLIKLIARHGDNTVSLFSYTVAQNDFTSNDFYITLNIVGHIVLVIPNYSTGDDVEIKIHTKSKPWTVDSN